jgi:hypothetical protein
MTERRKPARSGKRGGRSRSRRKAEAAPPVDASAGFWGEAAALPPGDERVRITRDPSAVVRSLGRPPLPGHETIAVHYFDAVYERTVTLATALAAAGDLIEPDAPGNGDDGDGGAPAQDP